MGPIIAVIYALLMIWAYGSQIWKLYKTKKTEGLSIRFFFIAWCAVVLRMSTVGFVIGETKNITAIFLEVAEAVVFIGLIIIVFQILYYHYLKKRKKEA